MPTPCSPLQEPPSASARATILRSSAQARSSPSGSGGTRITVWKLPSPTWPTIGAVSPDSAMSSCAPRIGFGEARDRHDGVRGDTLVRGLQRERSPIGVMPRLPQLRARSASVAQRKPFAPMSAAISSACCACSATPAGEPWNSKNSVGAGSRPSSFEIGDAGRHLHVVQQLDACDGNAGLHDRDHRLHRVAERVELAGGGGGRLRNAVQPKLDLGDHAERALRADEQVGEVVAGRRFAHAPAGADHAAVGESHRQAEHLLADGAVAHRVGAAGAGRAHAADGAVGGAGIDREEQALVAQVGVEHADG